MAAMNKVEVPSTDVSERLTASSPTTRSLAGQERSVSDHRPAERASGKVWEYVLHSRLRSRFLLRGIRLAVMNYYDDRFGITRLELLDEEYDFVMDSFLLLSVWGYNAKSSSGRLVDVLEIVGRIFVKRTTRREKIVPS